jgi:hypothetical protein
MRIRDALAKAKLPSEVVAVNIPGVGEVKVEVREKTVEQQYDLIERCRKPDGEINGELLAVETVMATSYDPDTGEPSFDPADRDMIRGSSASVFQKLLVAANAAAGLEKEEEALADLEPTPPAETSTG